MIFDLELEEQKKDWVPYPVRPYHPQMIKDFFSSHKKEIWYAQIDWMIRKILKIYKKDEDIKISCKKLEQRIIPRWVVHKIVKFFQLHSRTKRKYQKEGVLAKQSYGMCSECGKTPGCCCSCVFDDEISYTLEDKIIIISKKYIYCRTKRQYKSERKEIDRLTREYLDDITELKREDKILYCEIFSKYATGSYKKMFESIEDFFSAHPKYIKDFCRTEPSISLLLSEEGIRTIFKLQKAFYYSYKIPKDVIKIIIEYVYKY